MIMPNQNEKAAEELAAEKSKFGFGDKKPEIKPGESSELEDESEDKGDLDEEEKGDDAEDKTEEEEESDESEDDSDEEESDEEEDDDDSEKNHTQKQNKRKVIPFSTHNKLRKDLREAQDALAVALDNNKKLSETLPDDYQDRVKALAKEIGVEDPEGLTKIVAFIKESLVDTNTKEIKDRLEKMEQQVRDSKAPVDEFPKEWESFNTKVFEKEFPNATKEQVKSAQQIMADLAHSKKTGGRVYKDEASGHEVLDPFPLDYIFWKHKDKFQSIVTGKKVRGMEQSKTQRFDSTKEDGDMKHLGKNSSAADIRNLDKKFAELEAGGSSLRSPEDSTV